MCAIGNEKENLVEKNGIYCLERILSSFTINTTDKTHFGTFSLRRLRPSTVISVS